MSFFFVVDDISEEILLTTLLEFRLIEATPDPVAGSSGMTQGSISPFGNLTPVSGFAVGV
jgi:hypothetical protein